MAKSHGMRYVVTGCVVFMAWAAWPTRTGCADRKPQMYLNGGACGLEMTGHGPDRPPHQLCPRCSSKNIPLQVFSSSHAPAETIEERSTDGVSAIIVVSTTVSLAVFVGLLSWR